MNAGIEEAKRYYATKGWDFEADLGYYLVGGYVFSTPDRFMMAKPVRRGVGESDWYPESPDCWYVHYAAGKGCLEWFIGQVPYPLPFIGWMRNKSKEERFRAYPANLLCAKLAGKHHGLCKNPDSSPGPNTD